MVLLNHMSWEELADRTIEKIGEGLGEREKKQFKSWFMEREQVGYLFDPLLILRCFRIYKEMDQGLDHFVVICGREGTGKSTLAHQIVSWVIPSYTLENTCTKANKFLDLLRLTAQKYKTEPPHPNGAILDEGTELLSRDSLQLTNKILVKTFFVQRALRFLVVINIPNFHLLDSIVRHHRCRTLIEVQKRGKYKCITGKGIKTVARDGSKTKEVSGVKLKNGQFWHGSFRKDFPGTLVLEEYHAQKYNEIRNFIDEMKDESLSKKLLAVRKVAKEVSMSAQTLTKMIKRGDLEGKQIGSMWYITRRAYDKLITP